MNGSQAHTGSAAANASVAAPASIEIAGYGSKPPTPAILAAIASAASASPAAVKRQP